MTEVRINDRGPFVRERVIDLSHAAAQAISMPGIANVRLQAISVPRTRAVEVFAVQVGAFSQRPGADKFFCCGPVSILSSCWWLSSVAL